MFDSNITETDIRWTNHLNINFNNVAVESRGFHSSITALLTDSIDATSFFFPRVRAFSRVVVSADVHRVSPVAVDHPIEVPVIIIAALPPLLIIIFASRIAARRANNSGEVVRAVG